MSAMRVTNPVLIFFARGRHHAHCYPLHYPLHRRRLSDYLHAFDGSDGSLEQ
jgi:hypothetical protein